MTVQGIGAPVRRKEDRRYLTGRGTYTEDINRPGQLHAVILRSPCLLYTSDAADD